MLEHLAECEKCGVTLRLAAEAIHGEDAAESALGLVPAAQDQASLAKRLAQVPTEPGSKVIAMPARRSGIWKVGAIAAGITVLVGSWWSRELSKPGVETLLAQAYTARRPTEFRMPGGTAAPVRMDRSSQATFAKPRPLMDAESQIAQGLETNPRDGRWLKWKARAEMLEFQADEAISTLSRALEAQPNDAELQAELGAAYAQRAESEDQSGAERGDWSQALDKLTLALRANPALAIALYNRALVHEKLAMTSEALADWEQYLRVDSSSDWAAEARRHQAALEQKKNNSGTSLKPIGIPGGSQSSN